MIFPPFRKESKKESSLLISCTLFCFPIPTNLKQQLVQFTCLTVCWGLWTPVVLVEALGIFLASLNLIHPMTLLY